MSERQKLKETILAIYDKIMETGSDRHMRAAEWHLKRVNLDFSNMSELSTTETKLKKLKKDVDDFNEQMKTIYS